MYVHEELKKVRGQGTLAASVSLAAFGKDLDKGGAGKVISADSPVAPAESSSSATKVQRK